MILADTFFVVFEVETDIDLNVADWFDPADVGLGDDAGLGDDVGVLICVGIEVGVGRGVD